MGPNPPANLTKRLQNRRRGVSPSKLPARCPALILKQNRLSTPPGRSFFALKPLSNCLIRSFIFAWTCAKQRTSSKTSHSRPNCCIFLQQTAPFSPIGERTFSSCVRSPPCLGRKNRRSPQVAPAGCPAGQMTASRTPHPNRAILPPPLDRETPAPGFFPFFVP